MHRLLAQTRALLKKDTILLLRSPSVLFSQLCSGPLFLLLLLVIQSAIVSNQNLNPVFIDTQQAQPAALASAPLVCYPRHSCYVFAYAYATIPGAPFNQSAVDAVVASVAATLEIAPEHIMAFPNTSLPNDIDAWILANPNTTKAVILFENSHLWFQNQPPPVRYILQYNDTVDCRDIGVYHCTQPWSDFIIPLQAALDAAFVSLLSPQAVNASISPQFSNFPHPNLASPYDVMLQYGALFLFLALTFNYMVGLLLIVEEKEKGITSQLFINGLDRTAYWASWMVLSLVINTLAMALLQLFGQMFIGFRVFVKTDPALMYAVLWLSAQSFSCASFMLASTTRSTNTARLLGSFIFIITFATAPVLVQTYYTDPSNAYNNARVVLALLPWFNYYFCISTLINGASGATSPGLSWSNLNDNVLPASALNPIETYWSLHSALSWLAADCFIFLLLGVYLERVVPTEHGQAEHVLFFLDVRFWWPSSASPGATAALANDRDLKFAPGADEDVREEGKRVYAKKWGPEESPPAVQVRGLTKHFSSQPTPAVNNVWYSIPDGQLFGLLGHNGSGKSTTFNCLTGLTPVTSGDAIIFGLSVRSDQAAIRRRMGVCPQHDVLWDSLSAREHLELYATIKGCGEELQEEVDARIAQVKLTSAQHRPSARYSGGMRRRLSLALALVGDPSIVFLDEPTTGMDTVVRAEVWAMIAAAKRPNRVIVLTSHSMEEVDLLADKVAVMSRGNINAVGSVLHLKKRFGAGYRLSVFGAAASSIAKKILDAAPSGTTRVTGASRQEGASAFETLQLPRATDKELCDLFKLIDGADVTLASPTLEEVFLSLSRAEEEKFEGQMSPELRARVKAALAYNPPPARSKVSVGTQFYALFRKSVTFQVRNWFTCLGLVILPVAVLGALLLVNQILFYPLRVQAVCGQASAATCAEYGPNLTCLATHYSSVSASEVNNIVVGQIDTSGNNGRGVNANCNAFGCFSGLEKLNHRGILVAAAVNASGLGTNTNLSSVDALFDWHADFLFILSNTSCQTTYQNAFNPSIACASPVNQTACKKNVRQLLLAQSYVASLQPQACYQATTQVLAVPTNSSLDRLTELQSDLASCEAEQAQIWANFLNSSLNISDVLSDLPFQKQGLLGALSSERFMDSDLRSFAGKVWSSIASAGSHTVASARAALVNSQGISTLAGSYTPTLRDICSVPVFLPVLLAFLGSPEAVENICALGNNLDRIRGLSFAVEPDENHLERALYSRWFGYQVQTPLMATEASSLPWPSQQYTARQFYADYLAVNFSQLNVNSAEYAFTLFFNTTAEADSSTGNWKELLFMMDNAILNYHTGMSLAPRFKKFPQPFVCNRDAWLNGSDPNLVCDSLLTGYLSTNALNYVAGTLFPYLYSLHVFIIVGAVVYEKQAKLRLILRMNGGLRDGIYWSVTYFFFVLQFLLLCLVIYLMAWVSSLQFVTNNDSGVYFLFAFSWANLIVAYSFLLSTVFSNAKTATALALLLTLISTIVGIKLIRFMLANPLSNESSFSSLMWFPPMVMIRLVWWLCLAGAWGQPVTLANMGVYGDGAVQLCIGYMWMLWAACMVLTLYLDRVLPVGVAVKRDWLFFIRPSFWRGDDEKTAKVYEANDLLHTHEDELLFIERDDVKSERDCAVQGAADVLVRTVHLRKQFASSNVVGVKSLSLTVRTCECLGVLGHNGAGKTTLINMLVGLFAPSAGDAWIDGLSIRSHIDLIQTRMGVCNQQDLLWGQLTCRDHVVFFARLKGMPESALTPTVDKALADVALLQFEHRRADHLSGGMKRRLSVACALVGSPKVVYLDEPSTGLDPASKRALWDVISRAKGGDKAIVLTTHSMAEAEALCDRIAIMALGELQCVGTAPELKRRFAQELVLAVSAEDTSEESIRRVEQEIRSALFPSMRLLRRLGGSAQYEVDRSDAPLWHVFEAMPRISGVQEWSLSESSLESVFMKLALEAKVSEALDRKQEEDHGQRQWPAWPSRAWVATRAKQEIKDEVMV